VQILWLKTELLHPVDKGGKIRTYNMLKQLKRNHRITYLTLDDGSAGPEARQRAQEYCDELICIPHRIRKKFSGAFYFELLSNLASRFPYAIKKYESAGMHEQIKAQVQKGIDVLICDFLAPAVNVPRVLSCPTILFQHNVEAMIWQRHFEVQANPVKKNYLRTQWHKMENFERDICRLFDVIVAVSVEDREQIKRDYSVNQVFDVPTGVDTKFFSPSGKEAVEPHNVVFTGSMDWLPNVDGIRYFTEQILPLIRRSIADASLTIVGRNPNQSLLELSKKDPLIRVTGRVEDVRPYMERAAAYIVPLRIGGGTRLKIFEAMAMEKPVISTTVGAEGLPVRNEQELILADSPEDFASSVVKVLRDGVTGSKLGLAGATLVRENFGWPKVADIFAEICERTIAMGGTLSTRPEELLMRRGSC